MKSRRANPSGIALLVTLLGILVLEVIAAGTIHVATQRVRTAGAGARALRLQAAAQGAAAAALSSWDPDTVAALELGAARELTPPASPDGIVRRVHLQRSAATLYVLHSQVSTTLGERANVRLLIRTAAPADYNAAMRTAVEVAGTVSGSGGLLSGVPTESCGDTAATGGGWALSVVDSSSVPMGSGLVVDGAVRIGAPSDALLRPAGVELDAIATSRGAGTVIPAPTLDGGECLAADPGNWGTPLDPVHPCAAHFPVVRVDGDMILDGVGQGVVLVSGDATLAAGARFEGLLLVQGALKLRAGASVRGAARVGGGLSLEAAEIRLEPCIIARTAHHARGLRGPFRAANHWWVPM